MSYSMIGAGRYSSRLDKANRLRVLALGRLQVTSRGDVAYSRRLRRYQALDAIYSKVYYRISHGEASPDYQFKGKNKQF